MRDRLYFRAARAAGLIGFAGLAASAIAQDSVPTSGNTTDALDPYDASLQAVPYVVDLATLTSSFGNEFGVGPIVKSSLPLDPQFENALLSAQGMGRDMLTDVPFPAAEYAVWENAPGAGVNPAANTTPNTLTPPESGNQLGVAFAEFDQGMNNIVGALVNWDPANPTRLFVTRTVAATNAAAAGENNAQFGMGAADANGNVTFRADDFGTGPVSPGFTLLTGNNIFRVDMAGRDSTSLNVIDNTGGSDSAATDRPVVSSNDTFNVPNSIAESAAGRPVYSGSNFNSQYVFESAANSVSTTTAHLTGQNDHRGAVAFSPSVAFSGTIGTAGVLTKSSGQVTDSITVWGVDANGAIAGGPVVNTVPLAGVSDPIDPFTYTLPTGDSGFDHYHSQVAFRGGSSQVSLGQDQAGRTLAAATAYIVGTTDDPSNTIPVARFQPSAPVTEGATEWTLAAWVDGRDDPDGDGTLMWPEGKPILDASGAAIGELTILDQATFDPSTGEFGLFGPSFSAPSFDSVGNIWFLSAVQIYVGEDDDLLTPPDPDFPDVLPAGGDDVYTTALLRAVYDPTAFGYRLELVTRLGDTFVGPNSGEPYVIVALNIADSNSVSSGTFFSGNMTEAAANGIDPTDLETSDPRTMGGLIVNAAILYEDLQQSYNTLLFIGPNEGVGVVCVGDLTGDGFVDGADLGQLLLAWSPADNSAPGSPGDLNGDNKVDGEDLGLMLLAWGPCP